MDPRAWRLVPAAALSWVVTAVAITQPKAAPVLALLCGAAAVAAALTAALVGRPNRKRMWVLATLALLLGAIPAVSVSVQDPARAAAVEAAGGHRVGGEFAVVGKIETTSLGFRTDAVTMSVSAGSEPLASGVPVTVLMPERPGGVEIGAVVRIEGSAFPADPGERSVLVVRAERVEPVRPPQDVAAASAWLRERLAASTQGLPVPGAGLIPGLAVGDTGGVDAELEQQMRTASLTHLTAVSGANCAIVVGLAFLLAARCGVGRAGRVIAGLSALGGFVVLVTPEPSVVRAATMSAIAMLALLLGRRGSGLALLALAVCVLLAADPWLALSLGFALSVAATAALLVLAPPLARGLGRFLPASLALALAVPLSAQLVCGPLIVLVSPGVAVYGVPANLLAAPAAPVATVLGLAACLAGPVPVLQAGLTALTWLPAAWIAGIAGAVDRLPARMLPWTEGLPGLVGLVVVTAAVTVLLLPPGRARLARIVRAIAAVTTAAAAATMAGILVVDSVVIPLSTPQEWSIAMCDVAQGDAIVVRSAGAVMLVDTGPEPEALASCLARLGVARIDLLVLTHFDIDHVGGLEGVPGPVGLLVHGPADERDAARVLAVGAQDVVAAAAGMSGVLGAARWRVLWPSADAVTPGNDASIVVEVEGGGVPRTLMLGDLGADAQRALRAGGQLRGPYQVVKISHHGSADQDAGLQREIAPTLALIGVGADNDYGHPRQEILDLLSAQGATVARTDLDGLILVAVSEGHLTLWRERADATSAALGRLGGWRPESPPRRAAPSRSSHGGPRNRRRSS
ncbi:ComEC/Rec2 family competence protein [Microbacterium sp. Clip185]|uniref:ComEC/Rec2 family competence protein n=1 Tax=Microbacterium sp. Clip185 TaxID=3025663 RepID=UPI0023658FB1|nr:ComEC/Rec2 family competence protein [Microbacterium sp. Clip185]WDG19439.1 ComEC/Rec2 family competence protein [Microbacterium sp. Clip185]